MTFDAQAARIADLEADNARLRRLLDGRNAPVELRHRLRGTLGLLRAVIRRSVQGRSGIADYAAHVEDRIDALMRVQAAIETRGEVDLHTIIAEEFLSRTTHEGRRVRLAGPATLLQPRAAQVMGLVTHELVVNAVEHGALSTASGGVDLSWRVEPGDPDPLLTLSWKERGFPGPARPLRRGFGTEVLTELVQHELKARTDLAHESDGLRCTIRFPFPPRVGRLVATT